MSGNRFAAINRLLASAGLAAAASEGAGGQPGDTGGDNTETQPATPPATPAPPAPPAPAEGNVSEADAQAAVITARDKATANERARWNGVLTSEPGRANVQNAIFLLNTSPASADSIIGHLKGLPAAGASEQKPKTAAELAAETGQSRQPTAKIPVGNGASTAHEGGAEPGEDGDPGVEAVWKGVADAQSGGTGELAARVTQQRSASAAMGTAAAAATVIAR